MREQVLHRRLPRQKRIAELELGQVLRDRVAPLHLPFIDEHRDGQRRKRLRRAHDAELRVHVDDAGRAKPSHPVALCEQHRVVPHQRDGQAGNLPLAHALLDVGIELAHLRVTRLRQHRRDEAREEQHQSRGCAQ